MQIFYLFYFDMYSILFIYLDILFYSIYLFRYSILFYFANIINAIESPSHPNYYFLNIIIVLLLVTGKSSTSFMWIIIFTFLVIYIFYIFLCYSFILLKQNMCQWWKVILQTQWIDFIRVTNFFEYYYRITEIECLLGIGRLVYFICKIYPLLYEHISGARNEKINKN